MIVNFGPAIRGYLENALQVKVFPQKPATRPPKCIVVQQIPGPSNAKPLHLAWRRYLVHYWDASDVSGDAVGELGEEIRLAVLNLRYANLGVHRIGIMGEPGIYNDPKESTPRGQLTVDVLLKSRPRLNVN